MIRLPSRLDPEIAPRTAEAFEQVLDAVKAQDSLTTEEVHAVIASAGLAPATADSIIRDAVLGGILIPHRKQLGRRSVVSH